MVVKIHFKIKDKSRFKSKKLKYLINQTRPGKAIADAVSAPFFEIKYSEQS